MKSSNLKHKLALSRLEILLGLAVIIGLGYMIFLFGFSKPDIYQPESALLNETVKTTLSQLASRQAELNKAIVSLNTRLAEMTAKADCKGVERLQAELLKLNTALSLLEGPLAEVARLLPKPEIPTADKPKKTK